MASEKSRCSPKILHPLGETGSRFQEPKKNNLLYLKYFRTYTRTHDIRILFSFPPFLAGDYRLNNNQINSLVHVIRDDLALDILIMPEDMIYPESCFADTVNHLRPHCEKNRTMRILDQLKKQKNIH